MSGTIDASKLLRPGLLEGVCVSIATPNGGAEGSSSLAQAVGSACAALGAHVCSWHGDEVPDAKTDLLVIDGAGLFAQQGWRGHRAPDASRDALRACLDGAWEATHKVASVAFIGSRRDGRIVYVAPAPAVGSAELAWHAGAARAGLENLARTLSIEWARHGITTLAIAPGRRSADHEIAALVAYLGSPAGAYFSGCLFDLTGPGG